MKVLAEIQVIPIGMGVSVRKAVKRAHMPRGLMRTWLRVIAVTCALTGSAAAQTIEFIEPTGGDTQVVTTTDRGVKTVYVSGQLGPGDDYRAQVASAFSSVVRRLEQAGASVHDVVKMRAFVKQLTSDRYRTLADVRLQTFPAGSWPASTVVGVEALARESLQVEVEVVAVVAADGLDLSIERFAPSNGLSGAVAVTAHEVKTIYVSGQVGEGGGLARQSASVWQQLVQRLDEAGASYADLVKTTTYIVDLDPATYFLLYDDGVPAAVANLDNKAASTLLGVPSLADDRFLVEVDAIAMVGVGGELLTRDFIDPAGSFTQVVTARGSGAKTIYVSGQFGRPGALLEAQADQAYANLRQQLEAAGASPTDLVKVSVYIARYRDEDLEVLRSVRRRHGFEDGSALASTLLGIQSLYAPEAAIEVEGIAVVRQ